MGFRPFSSMWRRLGALAIGFLAAASTSFAAGAGSGRLAWCGTTATGARDAVWAHRERLQREGVRLAAAREASADVGQIAVLQDEGDLALLRNPMDLQGAALRFSPSGEGYSATRLALPLADAGTTRLPLGDDASRSVPLPFPFPFFGRSYSEMFVNSDGNLTFGEGDSASVARNVGRLVGGPPRIAPLLADFDPSAGGSVATRAEGDHLLVSWTSVPQFDKSDKNTFQALLYADGRIEFVYGTELSAVDEGAAGIAPGAGRNGLTALDLSAAAGQSGTGALAEGFRADDTLDTVAVAKRFYASHRDDYRQLIIFTSRRLVQSGVFAYEQTVRNGTQGIGDTAFDLSAAYGSAGRLESVADMDSITKYPDDPERVFLGEDSGLAVLAHEVGHRWLARALFKDGEINSHELLGRDEVHWSFFMDSDGSHLEGNDIQDLGAGQFQTVAAGVRYSALDQYLMGIRAPEEVPPFFVVRQPAGAGDTDPGRDPQVGVRFSGLRRDVTVQEVIAAIGPRNPPPGPQAEAWRQGFIFVSVGGPADPALLARVEKLRSAWEGYFRRSTEDRFAVDPRLD
jgi:hypothetical protein